MSTYTETNERADRANAYAQAKADGWTDTEAARYADLVVEARRLRRQRATAYPFEVVETTVVASNTEVARRRALAWVQRGGFTVDPTPVRNEDTERVGVRCARYVVVFRTV